MYPNKRLIFLLLMYLAVFPVLRAQDIIVLNTPEIVRVSVDTATGLAGIEWKASTSPDIEKYELYYDSIIMGQPGWRIAGTVSGDARQYFYAQIDPGKSDWTLTVLAYDSIGNRSNFTDFHKTMHLQALYDSCSKTMELSWSSYTGWDELVKYEVYFSVDGGSYSILNDYGPQDTSALQLDIGDNHRYCYFIKALSPTDQSFSNIVCKTVSHPLYPSWIDAESASAVGPDRVEVRFAIDPAGEVSSFRLVKASGPGRPFIADALFRDVTDSLVYQDPVISTTLRYLYKLYALDVCDYINPETASNVCGNIVLNARSVGLDAFLSWTPYSDYEAGVKEYVIYRDIKHAGPERIGAVNPPDTSFQDNLGFASGADIEDEICYHVVAVEDDSYVLRGRQGFSQSNQACVSVVPEIRMANAIIPNATNLENTRIKPELTFIARPYIFQVFDRWGSKIFETNDPGAYWYGDVRGGKKVPEGVYVYYIRLTTSSGIEVEKKGEITVFYK